MKNPFISKQLAVTAGAVTGTSMMTLYSILVSNNKKKNFKEPKLLGANAEQANALGSTQR